MKNLIETTIARAVHQAVSHMSTKEVHDLVTDGYQEIRMNGGR